MSYRHETESWIARVGALEAELAEVKAERDRLRAFIDKRKKSHELAWLFEPQPGTPPAFGPATEPISAIAWTVVLVLFVGSLLAHGLR